MDYIEWCDRVLERLAPAIASSYEARQYGIDRFELFRHVFGSASLESFGSQDHALQLLDDSIRQLVALRLMTKTDFQLRITDEGIRHVEERTELWQRICAIELQEDQRELLRVVNALSQRPAEAYAEVNWVDRETLLKTLAWADGIDALLAVAREIDEKGLVTSIVTVNQGIRLASQYSGLVWEHRRGFTLESQAIDDLVAEWETTSVEFKRELHTDTADQKAELIKDVIALANTQASGPRWLIVGFEDRTRGYYGPPDPKLTQEHLEQLMSQYTEPFLETRYRVNDYRVGPVGKLEVLRDAKKLPYKVAKSVGHNKQVEPGAVFVRHGSLSEPPTATELAALEQEGRRAREAVPGQS